MLGLDRFHVRVRVPSPPPPHKLQEFNDQHSVAHLLSHVQEWKRAALLVNQTSTGDTGGNAPKY